MNEVNRSPVVASGIVACTFFYFLIFAQFAFLKRIEYLDAEKLWLQPAMLLMGIGGVSGALFAGAKFRVSIYKSWLLAAFLGCGFFAIVAMWANVVQFYLVVALGVGVFLGVQTVVVVPLLRLLINHQRIGIWSGVGVGIAYFLTNIPVVFDADPVVQCCLAAVVCGIGVLLVLLLPQALNSAEIRETKTDVLPSFYRAGVGFWSIVAVLFALVWLDSAMFYSIQETPFMKTASWGNSPQLWTNALAHGFIAIVSGFLLDRGKIMSVLFGALATLVCGSVCLIYGYGGSWGLGGLLYVCGVSLYSTALVAFCALRGESPGHWTVAKRAGVLFAIAGWIASGLGIGMVRDLEGVPVLFLFIATLFILGVMLLLRRVSLREESL